MADIFLGYAHVDRDKAEALAKALQSKGWSVWWDPKIPIGKTWRETINNALDSARCIIALWSRKSVRSNWLIEEANHGMERGILIQVLLEEVSAPMDFESFQAANLISWDGSPSFHGFQKLVQSVKVVLSGAIEIAHSRSGTAITDYLSSIEQEQQIPINEVKVLFVGDGGSGKTSLLKLLIGRAFDKDEVQTHGIKIEKGFITSENQEIRLNLWDFGGQEIMHSTHQFFLSKRSIYVLVIDGRKEEDAEYWLNHIRTFGGDSPVILALNKIDENPSFEVNRKGLQEKYKAIKAFHPLSCKTGDGVKEFTETLRETVFNTEHLKIPWPKSWLKVKLRLEGLAEDYISYEKYEQICKEEGLIKENILATLLNFLNDLGVLLYVDSQVLRETNVINPSWVTGAVYQIINSRELAEGKGIIQKSALKKILDTTSYPSRKHDYIIELMKRFELCFAVNTESILVPDLLSIEEPNFDFNHDTSLRFLLDYEFLPKSVINRVIVNLNKDIKGNLCWRTGVVLEDQAFGCTAVIKADIKEKKISVWVTGQERREYFSIIRKVFIDINRCFKGLKVEEKIPCTCSECQSIEKPYFFEYSSIVRKRQKGKLKVECNKSDIEIAIDELICGIETPLMEPIERWDVFLSYSSKDFEKIKDIVLELKRYNIKFWWDHEQLQPGDSISQKIELGLRRSRFIMPCISRNQVQSGWCRAEYTAIFDKVLKGKTSQKVTPLILDDLPDEDMPMLLSDLRSERLNDSRSYKRLLSFLSPR